MFDDKFAFQVNNPFKVSHTSFYGELGHTLYKVNTSKQIPYFIRVDRYRNNLHLIKFYPTIKENHGDRYKIRMGDMSEFSRMIATCIRVATRIIKNNPEACFGFHGQWDDKDVIFCNKNKIPNSQRSRIYKHAIIQKVNSMNFDFYTEDVFNLALIIPKGIHSEKIASEIMVDLLNIYHENMIEFIVPIIEQENTPLLEEE